MFPQRFAPVSGGLLLVAMAARKVQIDFFSFAFALKQNRRASFKGKAAALDVGNETDGQPLRSPSAARFHCETLSAIMRVDFIAAWLSWA